MARSTVNKAAADPVQPYLQGVAKSLVDRLYGAEGPAWGTKLTEIEDTLLAVRQVLCESMLGDILDRQAQNSSARPAAFQNCPSCDQEVGPRKVEPRRVQTRVGQAQWGEPSHYCPACRRAFFPSEQKFGDGSEQPECGPATEDRLGGSEPGVV